MDVDGGIGDVRSPSVVGSDNDAVLRQLGTVLLDRAGSISEAIIARRSEVEGFSELSADALRPSNELGIRAAITYAFIEPTPARLHMPIPDDLFEEALRLRASAVAVDTSIRGVHVAFQAVLAEARDAARLLGADAAVLTEAAVRLWEFADVVTTRIALAYREIDSEFAVIDGLRRTRFLESLLLGETDEGRIAELARSRGLGPDESYRAFRTRCANPDELLRTERTLRRAVGTNGVVGVLFGDIAGVTKGDTRWDIPMTVAVGHAGPLSHATSSFQEASRVLTAAVALSLTGVVRFDDLGARAAVASETDVGAALVERFIAPVRDEGAFGSLLLETMSAYLDEGLRIGPTASRLCVHPNTLKHRLKRFSEITEADLRNIDDVVGIWWALVREGLLSRPR